MSDANPVTHGLLVKAHARQEHVGAPNIVCPICRRFPERNDLRCGYCQERLQREHGTLECPRCGVMP